MFTSTQIGALTLFTLSVSKGILGRPLLIARQNSTPSIGDFGSCSVPQIEFGVGFDNRKETSFEPVDKTSFNHGSAQAIGIITQFICDTLTNSCNADATAKATCASAQTAANGQTAKTGAQADAFNAVFGIKTNFAAVPVVSDQGVTLGVDGSATTAAADSASTSPAVVGTTDAADPCPATVTVTVSGAAATDEASATTVAVIATSVATGADATSTAASSAIGNFGGCSIPQIEFGVGFDNRKETSFEPVDKTSFNHGSAQAIGIITQFICDTLTNSCNADATAKATCASAQTAANGQTAKTGAQADAFNAVFGIKTNFAAVPVVSDQGVTLGVDGSSAAPASATTAATVASASSATSSAASSSIGDFGSCSVPQIEFGVGFDNRKETSFEPVDKTSFNHGSAQAIGIITQFICDTLTNSCNADATAKATCASAQTAANGQTAKTGAQADAFNAVFGIKTNFASVSVVSDTGVTLGVDGSSTTAAAASAATA
ncbi:hypothetical protein D9757_002365 [Collybiopsis confluens]|uniref:Uncharacterized protein n=1 Tax=Collybiopsis confluens TaxID=2823264 RepID=A0A8H5MEJ9_9AGAR|nr:hypothetical protein D9757_002365 [Collybiopsis confluens]